jgi:hypothetical protein
VSPTTGPFALTALLFSTSLQKLLPGFNEESDEGLDDETEAKLASITATVAFCVGALQVRESAIEVVCVLFSFILCCF